VLLDYVIIKHYLGFGPIVRGPGMQRERWYSHGNQGEDYISLVEVNQAISSLVIKGQLKLRAKFQGEVPFRNENL